MTRKEIILKEIDNIPNHLLEEAIDFIRFLKIKSLQEKHDVAIASESSLKKDWLLPEEEEAWQNL